MSLQSPSQSYPPLKRVCSCSSYPFSYDEIGDAIRDAIRNEIRRSILEVPFDTFLRCFLYHTSDNPQSLSALERDQNIAKECLAALQVVNAPVPSYKAKRFQLPPGDECVLHQPLVELMNFIKSFHSKSVGDAPAWTQPSEAEAAAGRSTLQPPQIVECCFVDTHATAPLATSQLQAKIKPDISLVLSGTPHHWKNTRVPVVVKMAGEPSTLRDDLAIQMASYARAMTLEQFDRKFFYSVSISRQGFRIWRWDAACAYVSAGIDYNEDPIPFIMMVQRLVSLDPVGLGYDASFSNAGINSSCDSLPATLTVTPSPIDNGLLKKDDGHSPMESMSFTLEPRLLFEARDVVFGRATRVWDGRQVDIQSSQRYAIKQNWQEDDRIPEPKLHQLTDGIAGIPKMVSYQLLESTRNAYKRVEDAITGYYELPWEAPDSDDRCTPVTFRERNGYPLPKICHRILSRLVFEGVGRPLREVRDPSDLLKVMLVVVQAISELEKRRILHRDISSGNILLSDDPDVKGMLIDFGLAEKLPDIPVEHHLIFAGGILHRRLTGTLPYIACDILDYNHVSRFSPERVIHGVHHDLESVFWVMFERALRDPTTDWSPPPTSELILVSENIRKRLAMDALKGLDSLDPNRVLGGKLRILSSPLDAIPGEFVGLHSFLCAFRELCNLGLEGKGGPLVTCDMVEGLIKKAMGELETVKPVDSNASIL